MKKSEALVRKHAGGFGFGHYKWSVRPLPEEQSAPGGGFWGRSQWNHQEEYFAIKIVPDGTLDAARMEHLVLHELAHGVLTLAEESEAGCELACNRIAKLVLGRDATGPNYTLGGDPELHWPVDDGSEAARAVNKKKPPVQKSARKEWMDGKEASVIRLLDSVHSLTARERYVLGAIYIQKLTFREVAAALKVSPRTVTRIRNQLVHKLSDVLGEASSTGALPRKRTGGELL